MILKKRQTLSEFFRKNPLKKISSETKRRQKLTKKKLKAGRRSKEAPFFTPENVADILPKLTDVLTLLVALTLPKESILPPRLT